MDIEWKEGAVCFAYGKQWFARDDKDNDLIDRDGCGFASSSNVVTRTDLQLNNIKQGDYIEASELGTGQKYNDVVEVFGLFGFEPEQHIDYKDAISHDLIFAYDGGAACFCTDGYSLAKRKLTYPQLMAIGELKRLELARYAPKIAPDLTPDLVSGKEVKMQKNKPVVAQVMIDLTERMEIGIKTYGEALRANNGRDALQDAYEEALDLACYLKQAMIERDNANTN